MERQSAIRQFAHHVLTTFNDIDNFGDGKMKRRLHNEIFALSLVFILSACGGGGGGGSTNPGGGNLTLSDLQGTWYGAFRDDTDLVHTISVSANSSGTITSVVIDGVNQGYGGTITPSGENTFGYQLNNFYATEGGFLLDAAATHMAFIDEDYAYGVMQKGASSLPTYTLSDLDGSWSGYSVELDGFLNVVDNYSSQVTVDISRLEYAGSNARYGDFNGYLPYINSIWGFALGDWQDANGGPNNGLLHVWLSADKSFAASWACDSGYSSSTVIYDVVGCSFSMWNKQ
jgi:hypothetical protein